MCSPRSGFPISSLKPGDEVTIASGFGAPVVQADRVEVILSVDGNSALTNQATLICCMDEMGVRPTGKHFETGAYAVTAEARRLLEEAEQIVSSPSSSIRFVVLIGEAS